MSTTGLTASEASSVAPVDMKRPKARRTTPSMNSNLRSSKRIRMQACGACALARADLYVCLLWFMMSCTALHTHRIISSSSLALASFDPLSFSAQGLLCTHHVFEISGKVRGPAHRHRGGPVSYHDSKLAHESPWAGALLQSRG